jgi:hypothetical protein
LKCRRMCCAARPRFELLFILSGNCILRLIRFYDSMNISLAQFALRWILMFDAVGSAIPGAKDAAQAAQNAAASDLAPLSAGTMAGIRTLYDARIRDRVHQRWQQSGEGRASLLRVGPRLRRQWSVRPEFKTKESSMRGIHQ